MTDYELIKAALREYGGTVLFDATHVTTGIRSPSCVSHIKLKDFVVFEPQA